MANIIDYIKWRGDVSFEESPFNEVDNLIFSMMIYVDLNGIVPENGQTASVSVKEAAKKYFDKNDPKNLGRHEYEWTLYYMARSRRFQNLILSDYMDMADADKAMLFTACTIHLGNGLKYIAYRGTTYEIDDWRLDFMISFKEIPAQKKALEYLEKIMDQYPGKVIVGGHSKGGNLALYAGINASDKYQDRLIHIISNDGPGICPELLDKDKYYRIKNKLTHIVPEFCVIGMLFESDIDHTIVASEVEGIMQHSGMTWKVDGNHFAYKKSLSENSLGYNKVIDNWIESNSMEQREAFTKDFFDSLKAGGAKYVYEISGKGLNGFGTVLLAMTTSQSKAKIAFVNFVSSIWDGIKNVSMGDLFRTQQGITSIGIILLGVIFLSIPQAIFSVIGGLLALFGVLLSAKRILKHSTAEENLIIKRGKLMFWMIFMCAMVFILSNIKRYGEWTSFIMAGTMLAFSFTCIHFILKNNSTIKKWTRILMILLAILTLNIGIIMIITPNVANTSKSITVGSYLIVIGIVRIIVFLLENTNKLRPKEYCYEEIE